MSVILATGKFIFRVQDGVLRAKLGCLAIVGLFMGASFLYEYAVERAPEFEDLTYANQVILKDLKLRAFADGEELVQELVLHFEQPTTDFLIGSPGIDLSLLTAALKTKDKLAIWYDPWDSSRILQLEKNGQLLIDFAAVQAASPSDKNMPNALLALGALLAGGLYIRSRVRTRIQ